MSSSGAAPFPDAPSGDKYSSVVSDANQTVSLVGSVLQLGREYGDSWSKRRRDSKLLQERVGHWAVETYDSEKRLKSPVLDHQKFERWLEETDCCMVPQGPCSSTASWSYLLYALGVQPGQNIIQWRPHQSSPDAVDDFSMQMEGASLVHIINLYSRTDTMKTVTDKLENWLECELSFGRIRWTHKEGSVKVHFISGPEERLRSARLPFSDRHDDAFSRVWENGTIWMSYLNALAHTVSNPKFALPTPDQPLKVRLRGLLKYVKKDDAFEIRASSRLPLGITSALGSINNVSLDDFDDVRSNHPLLVSPEWLERANRIRHRVLDSCGGDESLAIVAARMAVQNPSYQRRFPHISEEEVLSIILETSRMDLKFSRGIRHRQSHRGRDTEEPDIPDCLSAAIDAFGGADPSSWSRFVYEHKEAYLRLRATLPIVDVHRPHRVLPLDQRSDLWSARINVA